MVYLSEFIGSCVFLTFGYGYMCNISLKKTLVSTLNYIELVVAWSLAVGFALTVAGVLGGPAYLNPGVVIGQIVIGKLPVHEAGIFLLMEFLAAGVSEILTIIFFYDSFKETPEGQFRGIYSAYPVKENIILNYVQEIIATFLFIFIVFVCIRQAANAIVIGIVGFAAVAVLSLTYNSTGFSMNAMRSVFSSIWYAILPIPNKKDKVDWTYQIVVNLFGSSIGAILAVAIVSII